MEPPRLFGSDYSVYVRIARLCLLEKGVEHQLLPLDIFAPGGPPADYLEKHPFARIPAFEHDGFALYETGAIARYVDEAFAGAPLQPSDTRARARCNQLVSIADNYLYPQLVWGVYVERISKPAEGLATDETRLSDAVLEAQTCLRAVSDLMADGPWLVGDRVTLADLYAGPMFDYFLMTAEGRDLIRGHPKLEAWWSRMAARPSMVASRPAGRADRASS